MSTNSSKREIKMAIDKYGNPYYFRSDSDNNKNTSNSSTNTSLESNRYSSPGSRFMTSDSRSISPISRSISPDSRSYNYNINSNININIDSDKWSRSFSPRSGVTDYNNNCVPAYFNGNNNSLSCSYEKNHNIKSENLTNGESDSLRSDCGVAYPSSGSFFYGRDGRNTR